VNTEEVLRVVTEGMDYLGDAAIRREVGKSAISAARTRLGADVMHYLAEQALTPLAQPQSACAFYRGLRIVSIDGNNRGRTQCCSLNNHRCPILTDIHNFTTLARRMLLGSSLDHARI
jgi:hypothetical protein